ncbi:MAG: pyruvate dehydrogenase (acetyl-transferring) E1 component subunit alpha [Candidatus Micrarchaeaceae archaeon]
MIKDVFEGKIQFMQVMDEQGNVDSELFPKELTDDKLVEMLKLMLLTRNADAKAISLQRQGRAATYAPTLGEEAVNIGSATAMRSGDIFVPAFRQHGVYFARGLPLHLFYMYWMGFEDGNMIPPEVHGYPMSVPVGTQMPHSVGIAFAQKYKKTGKAVIAYVGDGGTSEGDFYEAINFAGVWKVPLVVIIQNNQWAISMPRSKQTAAQTLAQKGMAAGINGIQVDGNDVISVYKATADALKNADKGPTIIEAVTYRLGMHTTSDDPTKYRQDSEVSEWQSKDPILRLRSYLTKKGVWSEKIENDAVDEQKKLIDKEVEIAEAFKADPKTMFQNVYSFIPDELKDELKDAEEHNFWQG